MTKIPILFVESGKTGGGSFESLYTYLVGMDCNKFQPHVVYLNDNRYVSLLRRRNITVYILNDLIYSAATPQIITRILLKILKFVKANFGSLYLNLINLVHFPLINKLVEIVRANGIKILHLNDQISRDIFGVFVAKKTGTKCISHLRSMRISEMDYSKVNFSNKYVDTFIANSRTCKEYWVSLGIDEKKTKVVYNAISKSRIKPLDLRQRYNLNSKGIYVLGCVANFSEAKGHSFLIEAFADFVREFSGVALLLIGDGQSKEELLELSSQLGLDELIIFCGFENRAKEIIAGLDVLIVPSQSEAFGRTLLEAMMVGTPIVATNVGGIKEVIKDEYNGLLIEYGNKRDFSNAVRRLLIDSDLQKRIVTNGLNTISEKFHVQDYVNELEDIYNSVLFPN